MSSKNLQQESAESEHHELKPTAKLPSPKLVHAQAAATLENAQPVLEDEAVDVDSADPEVDTESVIPVQSSWIEEEVTGKVEKVKFEEHKKEPTLKEPSKKVVSSTHEESKKEENTKVAAPIAKKLNQIEHELEHTNEEVLAMESSVKKMLSEQETSTKFVVEL